MSDGSASTTIFDAFARYYDADYRDYVDDFDLILTLAQETGDPILELGCGTGRRAGAAGRAAARCYWHRRKRGPAGSCADETGRRERGKDIKLVQGGYAHV